VEPLFQVESGSVSFGPKVAPIFEWSGSEFYELSCWILLAKPSGPNLLHDTDHLTKLLSNVVCTFKRYTNCQFFVGKSNKLSVEITDQKNQIKTFASVKKLAFLASFADQGVLFKYPNVWIYGA
jgi:hypothetical protein